MGEWTRAILRRLIRTVLSLFPAFVANKFYFAAITQTQGAFPNGWLFGIDIGLPELVAEIQSGFPYSGPLDAVGKTVVGPFTGLPSGLTIYTVTLNTQGLLGNMISARPATSYTIP